MARGLRRIRGFRPASTVRRVVYSVASDRVVAVLASAYAVLALVDRGFASRSLRYPDYGALAVIASLMAGSLLLEASGAIQEAGRRVSESLGGRLALPAVALASALAAMATLNDAAVFVAVPLAVASTGAPRGFAVAVALAAVNVGSAISPVGNPQDIVIFRGYNLTLAGYMSFSIPAYTPALGVVAAYAALAGGPVRGVRRRPRVAVDPAMAAAGGLVVAASVASMEAGVPWAALAPALAALAAWPAIARGLDLRVPLVLWLMYALTGEAARLIGPHSLSGVHAYLAAYAASLAISNVPAAMVLAGSDWRPLHLGVNMAGVAHPYSSLANLIGLRIAGVKWREYEAHAAPLAAALFLLGLAAALLAGP